MEIVFFLLTNVNTPLNLLESKIKFKIVVVLKRNFWLWVWTTLILKTTGYKHKFY